MLGTEAEFKRTVDAAKGDGLSDDDRFQNATGDLEDDRLGTFYVDVKAVIDQAVRTIPRLRSSSSRPRRLLPVRQGRLRSPGSSSPTASGWRSTRPPTCPKAPPPAASAT